MRILFESRPFHPSIGGIETVGRQLVEVWQLRGHLVDVVTQTPLHNAAPLNTLNVIRQPSLTGWWKLFQKADIFVQSGISLKSLPLGLFSRTPVVFIHHGMLPVDASTIGLRNQLKRWAAHLGTNVAVSSAVAQDLPKRLTTVIHNPVEPNLITSVKELKNPHQLLFVGRLVSVKGLDIALHALTYLDESFTLTICGDGPERKSLEQLAESLGVARRVCFEGWVDHAELRTHARQAGVQIVPSRYEPFGIVALEAIALGCAVVASHTGGLPEAIGPCGTLVPSEDPKALADGIKQAASSRKELLAPRREHLAKFDIDAVAEQYLGVFKDTVSAS